MTIALFPTPEAATTYRDACDIADGLPRPGDPPAAFPYGWTVSWADVVERDGAWPIPVHPAVPVPEGVPVIESKVDF